MAKLTNWTLNRGTVTTYVVTLEQAKEQLRIESDFTEDDTLINGLIAAASIRAENYCNRFFNTYVSVSYVVKGGFPTDGEIELPQPFLTDGGLATSITYRLDDYTSGTFAPADLFIDSNTSTVYEQTGSTWPDNAISYQIDVVPTATANEEAVEQAVLIMIADMYENRLETEKTMFNVNPAVEALLYPYRENLGVKSGY